MKRGLKVRIVERNVLIVRGYNLFPDEKGTESSIDKLIMMSATALQPIPR